MNQFSKLLTDGAREVLYYARSSVEAKKYDVDWLESLADAMTAASFLENESELADTIGGIHHAIVDSGPLTEEFAPSFHKVVDAMQRRRKRLK